MVQAVLPYPGAQPLPARGGVFFLGNVAGSRCAPIHQERESHLALNVEDLYRRYGPMVLRRCRWMLRDEQRAQDAMQDVFVQLLRHEERLDGTHASSLLHRCATNVCLNLLRNDRRHPEDADEELLLRIASAEDHGGQIEARTLLDRLFRREKESTRTIAVLHLLDGFTLEEVAKETGLSVSGVRKRLRTLKGRLKELEDL